MVLSLLLEGNRVSTIERVISVYRGIIRKLLVLAGQKCERIIAQESAGGVIWAACDRNLTRFIRQSPCPVLSS
jgi:hypothetical protein